MSSGAIISDISSLAVALKQVWLKASPSPENLLEKQIFGLNPDLLTQKQ